MANKWTVLGTLSILCTLAACGDRPPFEKTEPESLEGFYQLPETRREEQRSPFESTTYQDFQILEGRLFLRQSTTEDGNPILAEPLLLGEIRAESAGAPQLHPTSDLEQISQESTLKPLLGWFHNTGQVRLIRRKGRLTLTDFRKKAQHWTAISPEDSQKRLAAVSTSVQNLAALRLDFLEQVMERTWQISERRTVFGSGKSDVETPDKIDEDSEGATAGRRRFEFKRILFSNSRGTIINEKHGVTHEFKIMKAHQCIQNERRTRPAKPLPCLFVGLKFAGSETFEPTFLEGQVVSTKTGFQILSRSRNSKSRASIVTTYIVQPAAAPTPVEPTAPSPSPSPETPKGEGSTPEQQKPDPRMRGIHNI